MMKSRFSASRGLALIAAIVILAAIVLFGWVLGVMLRVLVPAAVIALIVVAVLRVFGRKRRR